MADEWVGVVTTTAPKYLKGAVDATFRKRLLLALLRKKGRITTGQSSHKLYWDVKYAHPPIASYGDGGTLSFQRHNLWQQLELDWRGYKGTDLMTDKERLMNSGNEALIRRYDQIVPNLTRGLEETFATELYIDGYAAGNENRLHGIESFCGADTSYDSVGADVADKIAKPLDTYGGKSTAVGALGGSWSTSLTTKPNANIATDWPSGFGSTEYDYLSPKLINTVSTAWTGTNTWESTCERVLRQGKLWCTNVSGVDGTVGLTLLDQEMYGTFLNKQSTKQNIWVPHKESDDLGFPDAINFEGMAVMYEYGIPVNTGYMFNLDAMELMVLGNELFRTKGPEFNIHQDGWLFSIGFFGNMKYNPKSFAKLYPYAAS